VTSRKISQTPIRSKNRSVAHNEHVLPALDTLATPIPGNITISNRAQDNDLELVRKRLRSNLINHKTYNPNLDPEHLGKRYFAGVYELNNPKHVPENKASEGEPTNLYAMLFKLRQEKKGKNNRTYSVTAKNPYPLVDWVKTRAAKPSKQMIEYERNTKSELAEMQDSKLFNDLKTLTDKQTLGVKTIP
jgi:hypothetical protein